MNSRKLATPLANPRVAPSSFDKRIHSWHLSCAIIRLMSCNPANVLPPTGSVRLACAERNLSAIAPADLEDRSIQTSGFVQLQTPPSELANSSNGHNSGKSDSSNVVLPMDSVHVGATRSRRPPARILECEHGDTAAAPSPKKASHTSVRRKRKLAKNSTKPCAPAPPGAEELAHALDMVRGSCSRLQPLQQPPTTDATCAPDDDVGLEEDDYTLWAFAKAYNVKRHKADVESGDVVPGVNDAPATQLLAWRKQCSCITGFGLYQRMGGSRSAGGKRKASKPQLDQLKQRISISTQIQVAAAKKDRFVVRPSHIAGIGVFAVEDIPTKEVLMEYSGVLRRRVHADRLEDMYERMKCDHYLFSIDNSDFIVDATKCGGTCRFVNHSCGPNCEVRTVSVDGFRRILLCSLREIKAGEELCYDYRLAADPDKAIRCSCGSKKCRGWL